MAQATLPSDVPAWHTLTATEVTQRLNSSAHYGLVPDEAVRRLMRDGPNLIPEQKRRSVLRMVIAQFSDFMILVLIAAAFVSGIIGDAEDTIIILAVVLLNGLIGFSQDFRAERAMAALRSLSTLRATVVRDGQRHVIPSAELVCGDVVLLEAGSAIPADLRLIEAPQLKTSEAALTGESVPAEKRIEPLADAKLPVADRSNMTFKGTVVTYGRARGIVVATGMATELGKIAGLLASTRPLETPLQRRLAVFGRQLTLAILAVCALIFSTGLLRGEPVLLMLLTALSLAVAAIPEALPAVVTVMLALGARNLARRNALVRRLPAVETLGSVSCICTDKTGTLTLNEMRATKLYVDGQHRAPRALDTSDAAIRSMLEALALCNDAGRGEHGEIVGDPTEAALSRLAADTGFDKKELERLAPRRMELPFDSERKRMTTIHKTNGAFVAYTKGAPETVIRRCVSVAMGNSEEKPDHEQLMVEADSMAREGLRVLAVASRQWAELPCNNNPEDLEQSLTFLGMVGLQDPPRPEAKHAVALCRSAGITPVMVTGDHPVTARAIARALGMLEQQNGVVTGAELARLSDADLSARVARIRVYARVEPAQKVRIVAATQARGEVVAMTGDGVNDAPALARADIGVAMGKGGTDVARQAASLVLLDDNFATIVTAVEEGRRIFDNLRKFVRYVLTGNSAEIWTIFLAPFFGLPVPLLPIHILWINLVTDGLPGLALAAEPAEPTVMQRKPRPAGESVFARGMWQHILWVGLMMGSVSLVTQAYAIHLASGHWQTMVFTVLTFSQMGHVLAIRSERESLLEQGLLSNQPLLGVVLVTVMLQLLTIYTPPLNVILKTAPLTVSELAISLALSGVVFFAVECEKAFVRRGLLYAQ